MERLATLVVLFIAPVFSAPSNGTSPTVTGTASRATTTSAADSEKLPTTTLPSVESALVNGCESAVGGWSPWSMKAENIKANGCGRRKRTRQILDRIAWKGCDLDLAEYEEYCRALSRRETLVSFQWYFVDDVFGYDVTAVAGQDRSRRSAFRFDPVLFDPNRFQENRCPSDVTKRPVDFLAMIDKSGGMTPSHFRQLLRAISFLVKRAIPTISPTTTRMALMTFANHPDMELYLNACANKSCVLDRISKANFTGGLTRMATALDEARVRVFTEEHGMRSCSRRVVLLLTDGGSHSTFDTMSTWEAADRLKNEKEVELFVIGITELVNEAELIHIVSPPSLTHLYYMSTVKQTRRVFRKLRPASLSTHSR